MSTPTKNVIPHVIGCFGCGNLIDTDKHEDGVLYDAVCFTTSGNYGSRVFDSMGGQLWLYVCDECLVAHRKRLLFAVVRSHLDVSIALFNPDVPTSSTQAPPEPPKDET